MGNYSDKFFPPSDELVNSTPLDRSWITDHADSVGLAVVEIEKLWSRFKQLGANVRTGSLSVDRINQSSVANNIFLQNLLRNFPKENNEITFQVFLNVMKWAESSDMDEKSRALFHLLNNSQPINNSVFSKIFKHVYPDIQQNEITEIVSGLFKRMDPNNLGVIYEENWIREIRKIPPALVAPLFDFTIIAPNLMI
ncbi:hypothetical protein SNEBB_001999 [Seison nebaliae]|nr:hypothetical protein SNEBB_001999 [Seison nebaliae]